MLYEVITERGKYLSDLLSNLFGNEDIKDVAPQYFLRSVAGHGLDGVVDALDRAVVADHHDHAAGVVDDDFIELHRLTVVGFV